MEKTLVALTCFSILLLCIRWSVRDVRRREQEQAHRELMRQRLEQYAAFKPRNIFAQDVPDLPAIVARQVPTVPDEGVSGEEAFRQELVARLNERRN